MKFKDVLLDNERNGHLTKRLNRLSGWKFFLVLWRNNMGRVLLLNFLVLIFALPVIGLNLWGNVLISELQVTLPYYGSFGMGTGVWTGVIDVYNSRVMEINHQTALLCLAGALLLCLVLSGVFAVLRDSFWIGQLRIIKPFMMGVKANFLYAFVSTCLIAGSVYGLFEFYWWTSSVLAQWLSIVLTVLLSLVALLLAMYLFILCSVTVTYKQSVKQNLKDSWLLMWLNPIPNLFHFVACLLPVILVVLVGFNFTGLFGMVVLMFIFMVGAFYIPFVWQTFMMRTFALFHPVAVNKKGETIVKKTSEQGA